VQVRNFATLCSNTVLHQCRASRIPGLTISSHTSLYCSSHPPSYQHKLAASFPQACISYCYMQQRFPANHAIFPRFVKPTCARFPRFLRPIIQEHPSIVQQVSLVCIFAFYSLLHHIIAWTLTYIHLYTPYLILGSAYFHIARYIASHFSPFYHMRFPLDSQHMPPESH
jgi:hypothetical protein